LIQKSVASRLFWMELIVEMRFGSHLYGTATPESDLDFKGVYLPEARDILLQRVKPTVTAGGR
jgi:predicted nucleotidyltransferase